MIKTNNASESFNKKTNQAIALDRDRWRKKNSYYYEDVDKLYSFLIFQGSKVIEIGCGEGHLLEHLRMKLKCRCTGIDSSNKMIKQGRKKFPHLRLFASNAESFSMHEKFDVIILSDLTGLLSDVQDVLKNLRKLCTAETRIILNFYNFLWEPMLEAAKVSGAISPTAIQNWLSTEDIANLLHLNDFEVVKNGSRLLFPKYIPLISTALNKYISRLPLINKLCLYKYIVARPVNLERLDDKTVSVVIPARNEKGNIEQAVLRTPNLGKMTEIIFVEGNSTDGTYEEIVRVAKKYGKKRKIRYMKRDGKGKYNAVRNGYSKAKGDILMILDADLTVPPEDLIKFYNAIVQNKGEFINGTRLVYPMEKEAMRAINLLGNKLFSMIFTWLLDQRFKDTLCGTKVMTRKNYLRLVQNRAYFGDFDPFGDFDLLFGASKLNLKILEIPIRYRNRTYGETNIQRWKHGWILIKMCIFAMRKIKFI